MNRSELAVVVILRVIGVSGICAIPAILFPYNWMNAIHQYIGLGTLPDTPIVSYLARSLSAFYAALGGFTLYISLDIRRHCPLIRFWAVLFCVLGVAMLGIDVWSGLPILWTLSEGPPAILIGLLLIRLQRGVRVRET